MPSTLDVQQVSPALAAYTESTLQGDLWKRTALSARDRSVVTVAALIARNQTVDLPDQVGLALQQGVKPAELSEIIFHLAFYAGWPNALAAVRATKDAFQARGITPKQLPAVSPALLPLEPVAEQKRAARVAQDVGPVSPGLVDYTGSLLFKDLWLRPDPRRAIAAW